jgi:hypothetical protein
VERRVPPSACQLRSRAIRAIGDVLASQYEASYSGIGSAVQAETALQDTGAGRRPPPVQTKTQIKNTQCRRKSGGPRTGTAGGASNAPPRWSLATAGGTLVALVTSRAGAEMTFATSWRAAVGSAPCVRRTQQSGVRASVSELTVSSALPCPQQHEFMTRSIARQKYRACADRPTGSSTSKTARKARIRARSMTIPTDSRNTLAHRATCGLGPGPEHLSSRRPGTPGFDSLGRSYLKRDCPGLPLPGKGAPRPHSEN